MRRAALIGISPLMPGQRAHLGKLEARHMKHSAMTTAPSNGRGRVATGFMVPVSWELPAIIILVFLLLPQESFDATMQEAMNHVAPLWLSGVLGYGAMRMIVLDSRAIWTPLFWFRIGTIVYFGFGSYVPFIVNETTRAYQDSFFVLHAQDMLKVNAVVASGVATILTTNIVVESLQTAVPRPITYRTAETLKIGILFYATGAAIKYLLVLPNILAGSPLVIPGFIVNLTAFGLVGISLLTIWSLQEKRRYFLVVVALVVLEMMLGLLQLSKIETLFPFLAFVIGVLTVRATPMRFAAVAVAFWLIFNFVQPWITHARNENAMVRGGAAEQVPFFDRITFLTSYFGASVEDTDVERVQESMIRLSFVNSAAFVISQYDRGFPGDSLRNVLYSFIPRFVWPDKPEVLVGAELATLASGTEGNSISAGYFAEVYWNLGWAGILLLIPVGIAFNIASRFAASTLYRGDWIYLPVLFLNLKTAVTIDNFYIGFVGTMAIAVAIYIMLRLFVAQLQKLGILSLAAQGRDC
jgi:hypothetical protein